MYCTLEQVKMHLNITSDGDDDIIEEAIEQAASAVEHFTGRRYAGESETRFFSLDDVAPDGTLYFDAADLCAIDQVLNGDGAEIAAEQYITLPRNSTPWYGVKLRSGSWTGSDDIEITGVWAYSETPPPVITRACIRLAAWFYRQRDSSSDMDRPVVTQDGTTILPAAIPKDITSMILAAGLKRSL